MHSIVTLIASVLYLFAPLIVASMLAGIVMRFDLLPSLRRPIDAGRTVRGRRLLGEHKTWRAVAVQKYALNAHLGAIALVEYLLTLRAHRLREETFNAQRMPADDHRPCRLRDLARRAGRGRPRSRGRRSLGGGEAHRMVSRSAASFGSGGDPRRGSWRNTCFLRREWTKIQLHSVRPSPSCSATVHRAWPELYRSAFRRRPSRFASPNFPTARRESS